MDVVGHLEDTETEETVSVTRHLGWNNVPLRSVVTFMLSVKMLSTPSAITVYLSSRFFNWFFCLRSSCSRTSIFSPLIQMEMGDVLFRMSSNCRGKIRNC